ncbi:M23 family metallopeptidase [Marinilabilia salmonicolor]|uniref:M23 family metallopeptidase n=1 Tax=Marinilabilia salmonicolor TaxID=989 RepID=UPI00029A8B7B|nr:M23 family metallopeptidase [Marinilabilia salmonicolor]
MADSKGKRFFEKLKNKYKLAIFNEQTYQEVLVIRLSRLNVFTIVGASAILLIVLVILLIAFTGLREYIPGYPDANQRLMIVRNAQRVDSLFVEIEKRNKFIDNVQHIIRGGVPEEIVENPEEQSEDVGSPAIGNPVDVEFSRSEEDSAFRALVEKEEKYNLSYSAEMNPGTVLENTFFFTPLKGMVVNRFGDPRGHFGVDIVAGPGARVSAVMDGVVVFSGWTVETGYVIQVQHANNLISSYKHNERLLKSIGDHVKAGEAIAHVGNSGELTTGPHLHFELWYNGMPLDPQEYISF